MADLLQSSAAAGITPPDPMRGLNTLSSIIGIRQQQQALQTGQATQASAQAKATVDTQGANENQNLAKLLSDPVGNGIVNPDGTPTKDAQSIVMRAAPTTGADAYEKVVNAAQKKLEFNSSVNNLRTNERQEVVSSLTGPAADPNATYDDLKVQLGNLVASKAGTPVENDYKTIAATTLQSLDHVTKKQKDAGQIIQPGQEAWRSGALNLGRSILPAGATVGAGGIATPQQATTGAGTVNRNAVTGALSQPPGAPTGSKINPTPPQVAGATVRQTGTGNADIDTSNQVVSAQRDARANIDLTKRIDQLAEIVSPGAIPSKISQGLGALGLQDVNQARTELQKDLGRLRGNLAQRAGSDSRAATALEGLPTDTTPTNTIHQAMDVTRGVARQDLALGNLREKASAETKGQMNGFQGDYAHAVSAASPLMHEYFALSPQEQVGFFQRNFKTKEQAKAFRAQAEAVKKRSPDVTGQ